MPERVIFDTNIWISGLLWRGPLYQCLILARTNVVQLLYCPAMITELARKLRDPFGFSENRLRATLYQYRQVSERVEIPGTLHDITPDPDDDIFIECAVVGNAKIIVSGDHHLLDLGTYQEINILTAGEFVSRFTSKWP